MQAFYLYSTLGCHLCELAEAELLPWVAQGEIEVTVVDIAEGDVDIAEADVDIAEAENLIATYGTRIPVLLHCATSQELSWPFSAVDLATFINSLA